MKGTGWILPCMFISAALTSCTSVTPSSKDSAQNIAPQTSSLPYPISWHTRQQALSKIERWQINGKIAVQTPRDSGSATVNWVRAGRNYRVSLLGPFGSHAMKLSGVSGHTAILETSEGKRFESNSPEQLLAERWGYRLPVSYLSFWIRGLPAPERPFNGKFDRENRLISLVQDGYQVQFSNYIRKGFTVDLPRNLVISSSAIKSRIVIYQWQIS